MTNVFLNKLFKFPFNLSQARENYLKFGEEQHKLLKIVILF